MYCLQQRRAEPREATTVCHGRNCQGKALVRVAGAFTWRPKRSGTSSTAAWGRGRLVPRRQHLCPQPPPPHPRGGKGQIAGSAPRQHPLPVPSMLSPSEVASGIPRRAEQAPVPHPGARRGRGQRAGQRRCGERRRQLAGRALPSGAALMRGVPGCAQWEPALPAGWGCSEARVIDGLVFLLQSLSQAVRIYGRGPPRAGGGWWRLPGLQAGASGG